MMTLFRSIRWKLISSYVILAFVILGLSGFLASWAIHHFSRQQETQNLTNTAQAIADQAYPLIYPIYRIKELQQLVYTAAFFGNVRVQILDSQEKTIADSGSPGTIVDSTELIIPPQIPGTILNGFNSPQLFGLWALNQQLFGQDETDFLRELTKNSQVTIIRRIHNPWGGGFTFELIPRDESHDAVINNNPDNTFRRSNQTITLPIGSAENSFGYVRLSSGIDFGIEILSTAQKAMIIAASSSLVLAILLGLIIGSKFSKPITDLIDTSRQMASGNLSVRAKIKSKDEIGELSSQFNNMASELEGSFSKLAAERDALRRFIADASHELRTPITVLKNFNELLLGEAKEDPITSKEFLLESNHQIDRLIWITNNLLDFSRWDAGIMQMNFSKVDAHDLLESVKTNFARKVDEKNIIFTISEPPVPCFIHCDRFRLEIALGNLVDNAIKFSKNGGVVEIGLTMDTNQYIFRVKDDGSGIPTEDQPHIFERFYRGHNQTHEGNGLGLSIAYSIITAHNGEIKFESKPGTGSCFTVILPKVM